MEKLFQDILSFQITKISVVSRSKSRRKKSPKIENNSKKLNFYEPGKIVEEIRKSQKSRITIKRKPLTEMKEEEEEEEEDIIEMEDTESSESETIEEVESEEFEEEEIRVRPKTSIPRSSKSRRFKKKMNNSVRRSEQEFKRRKPKAKPNSAKTREETFGFDDRNEEGYHANEISENCEKIDITRQDIDIKRKISLNFNHFLLLF